MTPVRLVLAFALEACGLTYLLARFGWLAAARAAVLSMVILTLWLVWDWFRAAGPDDLDLLMTILVMILPALLGAALGLALGNRARAERLQ